METHYTRISLRLHHPHADLRVLCKSLNLNPDIMRIKGEINAFVRDRIAYNDHSFCTVKFEPKYLNLCDDLLEIMNELSLYKKELSYFCDHGGIIEFFIGIFINTNILQIISCEAMGLLNDLKINLDICFYDKDEI